MQTFLQYINESAMDNLLAKINTGRKERFVQAMATLSYAEESGQIYNARYKEMKDTIVYGLDNALQNHVNLHHEEFRQIFQGSAASYIEFPFGISNSATVKKELRNTEAAAKKYNTPAMRERVQLYQIAASIIARVVALKSKIIAGREKIVKPGAIEKWSPTFSGKASNIAKEMVEKQVNPYREEFQANMAKLMEEELKKNVLDKGYTPESFRLVTGRKLYKEIQTQLRFYNIQNLYELFDGQKLKSTWRRIVLERAKKDTDGVFAKFLFKNAAKLAAIIEKKGLPTQGTTSRINVRGASLENVAKYVFQDKSEFTVSNSMHYGYRSGRSYVQYPTRFHNVKLANGTMMKSPSEEKMNKEF